MPKNNLQTETHLRSVIKGIVWRLLASLATVILVFIFYRDITKAFEIGLIEVMVKFALYYGHERAWNSIQWGKINNNNLLTPQLESVRS